MHVIALCPSIKGKGVPVRLTAWTVGVSVFLRVSGKLCGRIIIRRVINETEEMIREEQCGFPHGRRHVDQIFTVLQLKKNVSEEKQLCFVDLKKEQDGVNWKGVWKIVKIHVMRYRTLGAVRLLWDRTGRREWDVYSDCQVKIGECDVTLAD